MSVIQVDGSYVFQWQINLNKGLQSDWSDIFCLDGCNCIQLCWNRNSYNSPTRDLYKFQLYNPWKTTFSPFYTFSVLDRERHIFVTSKGKIMKNWDEKEQSLMIIDVSELKAWDLIEEGNAFTVRFSIDWKQEGSNPIKAEASNVAVRHSVVTKDNSTNTAKASNVANSTTNMDSLVTKDNSTNTAEASNVADSTTITDSLVTKDNSTNTDAENTRLLETLSSDFSSLYENKTGTDCVLKTSDSQLPVHRAVLSARSSVFSAMFLHDTAENHSGEVDIPDIKAAVLDNVLYYVYSGKIKGLTADTAASMYTVADKYDLLELREECLDLLKRNLTMDNFCEAALLSHIHGEMELEEIVVWFIEEKLDEILENSNWMQFLKDRPLISSKLLTSALISSKRKVPR